MVHVVLPATPVTQTQQTYDSNFGVAGSKAVDPTVSTVQHLPNLQHAQQLQPPPATAHSCAPRPVPVQRRKARSDGPGKQGWKHEEDQIIVRMVQISGQKWSS